MHRLTRCCLWITAVNNRIYSSLSDVDESTSHLKAAQHLFNWFYFFHFPKEYLFFLAEEWSIRVNRIVRCIHWHFSLAFFRISGKKHLRRYHCLVLAIQTPHILLVGHTLPYEAVIRPRLHFILFTLVWAATIAASFIGTFRKSAKKLNKIEQFCIQQNFVILFGWRVVF